MKKTTTLFLVLLSTFVISSAFAEEIWIVGSANSTNDGITIEQVKESFLGNAQKSTKGSDITALDRKTSPDDIRAKFYKAAVGMSTTQLKAYWSQRIFTGRGYPPISANDVKKELQENPSLITFITPSEVDNSLKTLLKVEVK